MKTFTSFLRVQQRKLRQAQVHLKTESEEKLTRADEALKAAQTAIAFAFAMRNHPNVPHLVDQVTSPSAQFLASCEKELDQALAEVQHAKWDVSRQAFELKRSKQDVAREVDKERWRAEQ